MDTYMTNIGNVLKFILGSEHHSSSTASFDTVWVLTSQVFSLIHSVQRKNKQAKKGTAVNTILNKVFQIAYESWTQILDCHGCTRASLEWIILLLRRIRNNCGEN